MSTLALVALGVALAAVAGLGFGLPDRWFCALLSLACLLGGADAAYRETQPWPVILLLSGALFAGASAHDVIRGHRAGRQ